MNAERNIEMAEEALRANKTASASALYEAAALELVDTDRRRGAHLLMLAAWHADPSRKDNLAEQAQEIYESEGDDDKIAEVALVRAAETERSGTPDRARDLYITCVKHASMRLAQILATMPGQDVPRNLTPAMEVLLDQLAHCRAKLSELENFQ